jgi:uncharacterized protein (TIGR02444 family)
VAVTSGGAGGFWEFSLELYALPGVAAACLALQEAEGRDVNIVLFCLYSGMVLGRPLDAADLARLATAVAEWNALAVRPLRALRRGLKPLDADPAAAAFRRRVQALELEAERQAQLRLEAALPPVPAGAGGLDLARANLLGYTGENGLALLAAVRDAFAHATG